MDHGFEEVWHRVTCMPLFHVAGNGWLFIGLVTGCTNTLVVDINPEALLTTITEQKITCTLMVPAVIQMLVLAVAANGQKINLGGSRHLHRAKST